MQRKIFKEQKLIINMTERVKEEVEKGLIILGLIAAALLWLRIFSFI